MKPCDELKMQPLLHCALDRCHPGPCLWVDRTKRPAPIPPRGKYEVILADFPWRYTSFGTAKLPYKTMSDDEIAAFDWSEFMAKDCAVFSWATGPKEQVAFRCYDEWERRHGLFYQGLAFVWVKTRKDGTPIGASGPRPRTVKPVTELVHAFSTQRNKRVFKLLDESVRQVVFAPKPLEHSRKPSDVAERIVSLYGDRPRIELFCRGAPPNGWDAWGDEADAEASEGDKT